MNKLRSRTVALTLAVAVPASALAAEAVTLKGTNDHQTVEFESFEVGDVEGHILALHKNAGIATLEDGEIGSLDITGALDWTDGLGPIHGVVNLTFEDESTLKLYYESTYVMEGDETNRDGILTSCSGSGRFAGISECSGTYASTKRFAKLMVAEREISFRQQQAIA